VIQKLLDDKAFWECQVAEFEASLLDLTVGVHPDSVRFAARLYLQHMRARIARRAQEYREGPDE
jgi:hypothetical protein